MSVFGEFVLSWKCHNKRAQTERFKQQKFTPDSSGGFKVPDQGPINSISGESSSGIVDGHLSVSPHDREIKEESCLVFLLMRTVILSKQGPILITSFNHN